MATQAGLKVALLGAESTGKTALAAGIAAHWRAQGLAVHAVGEYLREWCEREGRTPRADEQMGIAQEQARRALQAPPGHGLVADTSPLMVAIYSDMLFGDPSLYDFALQHQQHYDLTLLTGLDLPWVADDLQRDGPHVREPVDALVRAALAKAGIAYKVIYGHGDQRLKQALHAIRAPSSRATGTWRWPCEKCSDPQCEHRLFSRLGLTGRPM